MGNYTLYLLISAALKSPWIACLPVLLGVLLLVNQYHRQLKRLPKKIANLIGDGLFWTGFGIIWTIGMIHEYCWLRPKNFLGEVIYWVRLLREDPAADVPDMEDEYENFLDARKQLP